MGYATTTMMLRDADSETEIVLEGLEGDSDDEAVIELRVTHPYQGSDRVRSAYVRLPRRHFGELVEWIVRHADALRRADEAEDAESD